MSKRMIFALHKLQCHILARSHQYWALLFHSQICRGLLGCASIEAIFATVGITAQHIRYQTASTANGTLSSGSLGQFLQLGHRLISLRTTSSTSPPAYGTNGLNCDVIYPPHTAIFIMSVIFHVPSEMPCWNSFISRPTYLQFISAIALYNVLPKYSTMNYISPLVLQFVSNQGMSW